MLRYKRLAERLALCTSVVLVSSSKILTIISPTVSHIICYYYRRGRTYLLLAHVLGNRESSGSLMISCCSALSTPSPLMRWMICYARLLRQKFFFFIHYLILIQTVASKLLNFLFSFHHDNYLLAFTIWFCSYCLFLVIVVACAFARHGTASAPTHPLSRVFHLYWLLVLHQGVSNHNSHSI